MKNYIVPEPQEISRFDSFFKINEQTKILLDDQLPNAIQIASEFIAKTLSESGRISIPVLRGETGSGMENCIRVMESQKDFEGVKNKEEAYALEVDSDGITLCGASDKGVFYGLQTLAQILYNAKDGMVESMKIKDWPDLKIRGVHVCLQFYGPINVPFLKRFIKACSANKINTMEIGLDNMLVYESYPQIASPWAFSKSEMKTIIDYAAQYYIKLIPVIQSLGHVDHSIFAAFPDLLEEPGGNTYCPRNEKVHEILFSVLDEVIELFDPPYVNIGHDEVDVLSKCDKCKTSSPYEIFAEDVIKINEHLKKRGVKTVLFGDMLLDPEGIRPEQFSGYFKGGAPLYTAKALELIPKDAIIADWHYDRDPRYIPTEDYPSISRIKNAGLDAIGYCAWYRPANSYCFSKCALKNNLPGLIATTWGPLTLKIPKAGGDTMQRLKYNPEALKGIERSAEYFWSVGRPELSKTDEMPNEFYWRELDYAIKDPDEEI